jgi:uncharacterized membrane protein
MRQSEEKIWSVVAHLGSLVFPFCALIVYLVMRERSRYVAHHSHQAMWFFFTAWIAGFVLSRLPLLGFLVYPFGLVVLAMAVVASVNALGGYWYEYPVVGRLWRRALGSG